MQCIFITKSFTVHFYSKIIYNESSIVKSNLLKCFLIFAIVLVMFAYIYIYVCVCVCVAIIFIILIKACRQHEVLLNFSRHPSLVVIALGRSSWRHPMSAKTDVSMCRSQLENVTYEFVLTSPTVSSMSHSTFLGGLGDRR